MEKRKRFNVPDTVTVEIKPSEIEGIHVAFVRGPEGSDFEHVSQGRSQAEAARSAADFLRLMHNECKDPETEHCWCRPETRHDTKGIWCCLCDTWTALSNLYGKEVAVEHRGECSGDQCVECAYDRIYSAGLPRDVDLVRQAEWKQGYDAGFNDDGGH